MLDTEAAKREDTPMDRTFTVTRHPNRVAICEVEPGSCAYSVDRAEAWQAAKALALPAPRSQDPKRRQAVRIDFQGLGGHAVTIQTRQATVESMRPEPVRDTDDDHMVTPQEGAAMPSPVTWIDQGRNAEAIENLREQQASGRANDFVDSLLGYYDRNGRLSDKQRDAVLRGIDKRAEARKTPVPDVPEGRYAVNNDDGALAFYRVQRPTEGRWAGYTFVKVLASDTEHNLPLSAAKGVLAKIAADPKAASVRYGQELGCCGVCGRTLTDAASRAAGIGPICAQAF